MFKKIAVKVGISGAVLILVTLIFGRSFVEMVMWYLPLVFIVILMEVTRDFEQRSASDQDRTKAEGRE